MRDQGWAVFGRRTPSLHHRACQAAGTLHGTLSGFGSVCHISIFSSVLELSSWLHHSAPTVAIVCRCGNLPDANPRLRALLAPTRWQHGDVALMCLSTMQIAYSWIILPQVCCSRS